ncbi:uncharacterized protein CPUR_02945 [Claviceps purpurea 20.1]|uniref:Uncharacterized protein n=1 Tax=Claviceps purpurea (strain 20.1) TaxID=1111077 RepID=M1VVB9_CLAP2|nr:uncharacterized protein CPUR_02945 [Claviceps purpurea 20.1]
MYALRDIPGKGKGLVATRNIPKGTRILSERPLIHAPFDSSQEQRKTIIYPQVEALNKEEREIFLSFPNRYAFSDSATRYNGIFRTNCISAASKPRKIVAFFPLACRINHDCDENATKDWNPDTKRHTVHAMRDIEEGEEITVAYVPSLLNQETRQNKLERKFHFACICRTCSLPDEQRVERDLKIDQILCLISRNAEFPRERTLTPSLTMLKCIDTRVSLLRELHREDKNYGEALSDAAKLVTTMGDLARGRVFAQKTAAIWQRLLGSGNSLTKTYTVMAQSPSPNHDHRFSIWPTHVNDVPQGLGPDDFDDWLWRREKPTLAAPRGTIMERRDFFSPFSELPHKNGVRGDIFFQSRRHWCFLGQILEDPLLIQPLSLEVMDMYNKKTKVHFYTETKGAEVEAYLETPASTVAILNATRHDFHFGPPGIRHEDPRMIKIIPHPLSIILALEHEVRSFSTPQGNDLRCCHGCGRIAASSSMKRCAKCRSLWYCSKDCQMVGWVTKAHKIGCKILEDPDLRGLFLTQWDKVENCTGFPLKGVDGPC